MAYGAKELARDLSALTVDAEEQSFAPLAVLTLRFDGTQLKHIGKAVYTAFDLYASLAREAMPTWLFGHYSKPDGKSSEVRQPKDLRAASSRTFLRGVLESMATLPPTFVGNVGIDFVAKDGPRPWKEPGMLAAERASLRIALTALDDKWAPGGTLSFGIPLSEIEDPARRSEWLQFGDRAFEMLAASAGWFGPALWAIPRTLVHAASHEIDDELLISLCTQFPHVDLPILYSGNSNLYGQGWVPSSTKGLVGVNWTSWLERKLAVRVKNFAGSREEVGTRGAVRFGVEAAPPWQMNKDRYTKYRDAKRALSPALLSYRDADETWRERAYLRRFDAERYQDAHKQLVADRDG